MFILNLCSLNLFSYGKDKSVLYPSPEKMVEYAAKLRESSEEGVEEEASQETDVNTLQQLEQLRALADRNPLHELHEQERKTMWLLRHHCLRKIPTLLAKLLHCVEWNDHRYFERTCTFLILYVR